MKPSWEDLGASPRLENNMKFGFELTRIVAVYEMVERPISSIFYAHVI
jgi:hypothetical protein